MFMWDGRTCSAGLIRATTSEEETLGGFKGSGVIHGGGRQLRACPPDPASVSILKITHYLNYSTVKGFAKLLGLCDRAHGGGVEAMTSQR